MYTTTTSSSLSIYIASNRNANALPKVNTKNCKSNADAMRMHYERNATMEGAWCISCKAVVSSFHAAHKLPCSACGGTDYVIIQKFRQDPITECDTKAEQLMRTGRWDDARQEYLSCLHFEASEINLRIATLEWRQECAGYVLDLLNETSEPMLLEEFKEQLLANYDEYVTQWLLQDYNGIRLIPSSSSYLVTINDTTTEV